jgi:hypothetical protein
MSGKTYNVNAQVTYTVDVITTFVDDGKTDLEEQAREAAMECAIDEHDMPMTAKICCELQVDDLVFEEE